jgi:hypothetical protein
VIHVLCRFRVCVVLGLLFYVGCHRPPPRRNTYLDPSQTWLEFTANFTITGEAFAQLDGSAHSMIRKIEVFSSAGSNLLESIDNYGVLYQACANVVDSPDSMCGTGGITEGYEGTVSKIKPETASTAPFNTYTTPTAAQLADATYTFHLPLMALIGTLGDKYIPLHALAADLRVEITWQAGLSVVCRYQEGPNFILGSATIAGDEQNIAAGVVPNPIVGSSGNPQAITACDYRVQSVYLHCAMVQVSDDAQAAIDAVSLTRPVRARRSSASSAPRPPARSLACPRRIRRTPTCTCPGRRTARTSAPRGSTPCRS